MLKLILRRIALGIATVALVSAMIFAAVEALPGDACTAILQRDAQSLIDHTAFLANSISFELAAILGMINIEQNGTIKIFSVAAVVFLPPTLVASIYGMNFEFMPELHWPLGYPGALGLMVASAVVTWLFFKGRGWL